MKVSSTYLFAKTIWRFFQPLISGARALRKTRRPRPPRFRPTDLFGAESAVFLKTEEDVVLRL